MVDVPIRENKANPFLAIVVIVCIFSLVIFILNLFLAPLFLWVSPIIIACLVFLGLGACLFAYKPKVEFELSSGN